MWKWNFVDKNRQPDEISRDQTYRKLLWGALSQLDCCYQAGRQGVLDIQWSFLIGSLRRDEKLDWGWWLFPSYIIETLLLMVEESSSVLAMSYIGGCCCCYC